MRLGRWTITTSSLWVRQTLISTRLCASAHECSPAAGIDAPAMLWRAEEKGECLRAAQEKKEYFLAPADLATLPCGRIAMFGCGNSKVRQMLMQRLATAQGKTISTQQRLAD